MDQTIATRVRLVKLAADLGALLVAAHLPAPYAVRAWREGNEMHLAAAGATNIS